MRFCLARDFKYLKELCHKIFDLQFFSWFEPIRASDKQAKIFSNLVSISPRYLITKWSPQCAIHRWDQKIFLVNQHFILHIFSFMIDVFTPKRIPPYFPFKSKRDKRRFRFHLPSVQFVMHTAEIILVVWCTPRRSSQWYDAHRGDHLSCVLHTVEIISAVCSTLGIFVWGNTYSI